ncbi:hypothetical protein SERLADRAFT_437248 [Serpula lacrymans var. lacrymans S7.9]|uniref:Uncharacterized protein n=1 Tax=Serpula lacrymans var. lacrymans (strain S7.9) TaxID=578457 RepID=F8NT41_SERL9|nr:uncharacterized protein SERLADRAFT_437248 [Serpula lacrymans var. lacrymans S7.9]EGO25514.1 hypothetical protein SERLADRAFT_437248 [Serpula lacrymans var. lacrymans S7.9]
MDPLITPSEKFLDFLTLVLNMSQGHKIVFYMTQEYTVNPSEVLTDLLVPHIPVHPGSPYYAKQQKTAGQRGYLKEDSCSLPQDNQPECSPTTENALKCRIAELQHEVDNLRDGGPVKQKNDDAHYEQVYMGRCLRRLVSTFEHPRELVDERDRRLTLTLDDTSSSVLPTPDQERLWLGYQSLKKYIPLMKKYLEADVTEIELFYKDICQGGDHARADDSFNLKSDIIIWTKDMFHQCPAVCALHPTNKLTRGFENEVLAELLCPAEF